LSPIQGGILYEYAPNDVLLYESLFRHYRNAVVAHIRTCMQLAHGRKASARLRECFGAGWADTKAKVEGSMARGAVARVREDEFDYLDLAQFDQVVDHEYEHLVGPQWLGAQQKSSKRQLRAWLQEVKGARDPAAHPGTLDADVADVIRAVDTCLRVLRRLGTSDGVGELEDIQKRLYERAVAPVEIGSVSPLDDSMPPAETVVENFVGRGHELMQLRAWLRHPHKNRWMLVGDGGKGKSAIAYEFAREVIDAAPPGLCGAFWLSAKRRKYELDRVVDIPTPDFTTLGDCLDRILIDYGHHDALGLSLDERQEQVLVLLSEMPCLLVVDDLDSVDEENEDVVEFLTLAAPQTRSKVLLTSRRKFAGMGSTLTPVPGLEEADALAFIDTRWLQTGLDEVSLPASERQRISQICEGSPLYMGDLLRLCAVAVKRGQADVSQVISDWAERDGDAVRRYALQREMDMLTKQARRVLEVLAVVARPMTLAELSRVSGMNENAVAAAGDELRQLYLLSAPALDEDTPRFAVEGNLAVLVRAEVNGSPREQQIKNALAGIEGKAVPESEAVQVRDLSRQARLLLNSGKVADAEQLLATATKANPDNKHLLAMLGMTYVAWQPRRNADARTQFLRAADLGYGDRGMYLAWSRIEGELGNWQQAVQAAERGLAARNGDPMLLRAAGEARLSLAKQLVSAMNRDRARDEYETADGQLEQAAEVARKLRLRAADITPIYRLWVRSAKEQGRHKAVCYRLDRWQSWRPSDYELKGHLLEHAPHCPDARHRKAA
jgi:hypothetical protein